MADPTPSVHPVRLLDLPTITRMVYDNMAGADQQFTQLASYPLARWAGYLFFPIYLLLAGRGYKVTRGRHIAGCAYLHLRQLSGFVFNVSVNRPYRRQGIGRQLMAHLETVTQASGRPWRALQVDKDNPPAQNLYQQLGYRPYHPHFRRRRGYSHSAQPVAPGIAIEALNWNGRRLFDQYTERERHAGDKWASRVVSLDYPTWSPTNGRYWRCLLNGQEIGCAWLGEPESNPVISLTLRPDRWGHATTPGLITLLAAKIHPPANTLDLYLGSSTHHAALAPLLQPFGFAQECQQRILMLKLITAQ
jgi:GNAT superfamily N-acetyltransferase